MSDASVIVLDAHATDENIERVRAALDPRWAGPVTRGDGWMALQAPTDAAAAVSGHEGVARIVPVGTPFRLASRSIFDTGIAVGVGEGTGSAFGGREPIGVIAGMAWAAGSEVRLAALAPLLARAGASVVHVGAPFAVARPDARDRLRAVAEVVRAHRLALSVEIADPAEIDDAAEIAQVLQIGSHNMQDFTLLRALGACDRPVLLKRGPGATVEEFLLAAEYLLSNGNGRVILCEAGIRTFDAVAKPRFEVNAIALLKQLTHLPVIADPSRCAPSSAAVPPLAKAAIAAGADGLVIEVGTEIAAYPDGAVVGPETLRRLVAELAPIARAVGREMPPVTDDVADASASTADDVLHRTDRTLAQEIETVLGVPPQLDVIDQWRIDPAAVPASLIPPFEPGDRILARCTGYRTGDLRLSRNLAFVDLDRIDPTIGALLEAEQLNLGQLFVDPRIRKLGFEFGTDEDAGDINDTLARCFPGEQLRPSLWRRYHAAIDDRVVFVVIETLPVASWASVLPSLSPTGERP